MRKTKEPAYKLWARQTQISVRDIVNDVVRKRCEVGRIPIDARSLAYPWVCWHVAQRFELPGEWQSIEFFDNLDKTGFWEVVEDAIDAFEENNVGRS